VDEHGVTAQQEAALVVGDTLGVERSGGNCAGVLHVALVERPLVDLEG
jgi:hypothetical protein